MSKFLIGFVGALILFGLSVSLVMIFTFLVLNMGFVYGMITIAFIVSIIAGVMNVYSKD